MVLFFLDTEKAELPLDDAGQTRHFKVSHHIIDVHSCTILKMLRRKQGPGDFDRQDVIGWIPGVSDTKKSFRNWAVYITPSLKDLATAGNEDASDLTSSSPGDVWALISHWFCWVEDDTSLALISSHEEKQQLLKFANVVGASESYITALKQYEVFL